MEERSSLEDVTRLVITLDGLTFFWCNACVTRLMILPSDLDGKTSSDRPLLFAEGF